MKAYLYIYNMKNVVDKIVICLMNFEENVWYMFSSIYRLEEKTVELAIAHIDTKLSYLFPYLPAGHLLI